MFGVHEMIFALSYVLMYAVTVSTCIGECAGIF